MHITILPVSPELKDVIRKHGADGWTVMQNVDNCPARNNQRASLVAKNNVHQWLLDREMRMR